MSDLNSLLIAFLTHPDGVKNSKLRNLNLDIEGQDLSMVELKNLLELLSFHDDLTIMIKFKKGWAPNFSAQALYELNQGKCSFTAKTSEKFCQLNFKHKTYIKTSLIVITKRIIYDPKYNLSE